MIFIIDDNEEWRKNHRKMFEGNGYKIIEADNPLDVVQHLMRHKEDIELVLLDIQMPEADGREILEMIEDYTNKFPIMVCSVMPIQDQKLKIPRARDYYHKGDGEKVLIDKVQALLG